MGAAETQTKEMQLPRGVSRSIEVSEKGKAPVTRVYLAPGVKFEIIAPTTTKVEVFNSESGQLSASSSPVDSWLRHSSLMSNYTCNRLNLDRLPPKN